MRHFRVTITEIVYVEDDTDDNVKEIAIEHLDEFFPHGYDITVEELSDSDLKNIDLRFALRDGGWAVDSEKTAVKREP